MKAAALALLAFALAAIASAGTAAAAGGAPFQALLNSDGSGHLFVNDGTEPSWAACNPDRTSCRPFAAGGDVSTAGATPETVFWAGGEWLSPLWRGTVAATGPPAVEGAVRANELVTPVPGQWRGGWADDRDAMQLAACATPAGGDCTTLTSAAYVRGCPQGATVLDPVFAGRYLRVADRRVAADATTGFEAALSPYGEEAWPVGPITSAAVVGRIARAAAPRAIGCGPPPLVRASISAAGIASVRCGLGCRAELVGRGGGREVRRARRLAPYPLRGGGPVPALRLPRRALNELGRRRAELVLFVDGKRAARRAVPLG